MKKIISSLTAMVMAFSLFSGALPASAEETASPAIENDISVEGTNSFGDLLADKITAKTAEQQANNGCNIFSAEVTGNKATISFETLKDCTLIAAIYDEAGNQMLASGSEYVEKGEKEKTVTIDIETMPKYFYFKAFLVDMVTLKPISTVYESPNYTQEMQEFFAKTVDDFDAEKVLNLDDNNSTNFAVFGEDTKIITTDGESNKVTKADDANQQYVFENADETMTALKVGDIFAYQYESKEMLIVKVGKIDVSGTTMTVTGEDTTMENVFEYVKIETDSDMSDATVDGSSLPEGITYADNTVDVDNPKAAYADGGYMPEKYSINDINEAGFAEGSIKAVIDDFYIGDKDSDNYAKVSGSAELGMDLHFQLYLSWSYQHFELKDNYSVKVALAFEGQVEGSIPLGLVIFNPVPGVTITITPSVVARLNAKIEVSLTMTGTIGFNINTYTGFTSLCTNPEFDTEIKIEGTFFIGISFKPELDLGGKWIAEASLTAEAGLQIKATLTTDPPQTVSKRHSCKSCIDGDVSGKLNFSAEVTFLNSKDLTWGYESDGAELKLGDFYWSFDKLEGGRGECPYCEYLVKVVVEDEHYNRVSGALVSKITDSENYAETDENGEVRCYVPGGEVYSLMARKANKRGVKSLNIDHEGSTVFIYLNTTLPGDPIDISFSVADKDGNAVEGAEISNDFNDETAVSDAEGKAVMKLPEGYYKFSVKAEGFSPLSEHIIVDKDNCDLKITVKKPGETGIPGNLLGGLAGSITGGKSQGIIGKVKEIYLSDYQSAAVTEDGSLYTWGLNTAGELGNGAIRRINSTPTKIMNNVKSFCLGYSDAAAITEDGSLYMWGDNAYGQLGNGESGYRRYKSYYGSIIEDFSAGCRSTTPIKIMDNVASVSIGGSTTAAITKDGSLYTWGSNSHGQLGNGKSMSKGEDGFWQNAYSSTPIKIMNNVKSVSLGGSHIAAITEDGSLYMWGCNSDGQLGNGTKENSSTPIKIMDNVKSISGLGFNINGCYCEAITEDGSLYTWGRNSYGRLGNGTEEEDSLTPIKIMDNVKAVSCGGVNNGAITEDGSLYAWGINTSGALGDGTWISALAPKKIMDNVKSVSFGKDNNSAAITEDGSLYTWGFNGYGQLGNGKSGYYIDENGNEKNFILTPIKVMDNVKSVSLSYFHSGAITEDGNLYMWGCNSDGQIGNGKDNNSYIAGSNNCPIPTKINDAHSSLSTVLNTRRLSLLSDEPAEETGGVKSYTDLKPNTIYNFYCLKTRNTETPLSGENILYVNQYVSDENGNLNISYEPKEEYADAVTLLTTSATTDISGAKVTVPDIVCNGEEQFAKPTVTLDGVTLTEGIDYDVEKDFSTSVPGDFEIIISGAGDYSGKVTASYKATCAHNYENGVCTICGEAGFILGDASSDGVFNIRDAAWICIRRAKGEVLTVENNPAADYNGDNKVDVRDAAAIAIHFAKITE